MLHNCISKSMMKHQRTIKAWVSDDFWKYMFVDSLTEYLGPPIVSTYWAWSNILTFEDVVSYL